ncbi:Wadjet anti-phage system protein JetA family protein [Achromobacter marplatensis]|uniref:Wadjet anti-phage system protein JetA family protein n=1 Tax=Achromobacter marplatensis TaxID=470868 RepID=UPI0028ECEB73|nr:Wadjet anti-phage system protein JetA family protein [Achromobacter marplatensis]
MAVPGITPASMALFQRVPDRLFGPLASQNRHGYWALLCHLHRRRFGPDAPLPPSYGFLQREITQEIEDHLKYADEWQPETDDQPDTPLNVRALGIFNRMLDAGWFRLEKYGLEKTVSMAPAVAQLLTQLITFAETGPLFVSGKIRSIDAAVAQVHSGDAGGDLLREAAEQCRNLLVHIRNTGTTVRDLMAVIGAQPSTAQYVRTFFQDYIQQVFIGDYQELRTREHPLSKRQRILDAVSDIDNQPELRGQLLDWYVNRLCNGNDEKGQAAFQRDLQRLYELDRIEEYLERLDEEIRSANRRALAFLEYKLRAIRPIDNLLRQTLDRLIANPDAAAAPVFPPDALMSGARLAQPRKEVSRIAPTPLRTVVISDRTRAINNLARRAQERRTITPMKLRAYADKVLETSAVVNSDALPCGSIEDLRAFQVLTGVAMATNSGIPRLEMEGRASAPGIELRYTSDEAAEHPHLSSKPFKLSWRKRRIRSGGQDE